MIGTKIYKTDLSNYMNCAIWANANGAIITDKGEYYEVEALPLPSLEELKKSKLSNAHTLFVKKRDAVVWVDLPDGRYGFDTAPEDIVNFMSAVKSAELDGSSIYKVWATETTKTMREFSIADFNKVFVEARKNQLQAYAWFEKVRAEINACNTKEELDKIGEEYGTKIN